MFGNLHNLSLKMVQHWVYLHLQLLYIFIEKNLHLILTGFRSSIIYIPILHLTDTPFDSNNLNICSYTSYMD